MKSRGMMMAVVSIMLGMSLQSAAEPGGDDRLRQDLAQADREHREWLIEMAAAIRRNLLWPEGVPETRYRATMILGLRPTPAAHPKAQVVSSELKPGTGDESLDQAIQQAVKVASPLPMPKNRDRYQPTVQFVFVP